MRQKKFERLAKGCPWHFDFSMPDKPPCCKGADSNGYSDCELSKCPFIYWADKFLGLTALLDNGTVKIVEQLARAPGVKEFVRDAWHKGGDDEQ